jgi:hypothetical protein
VGFYNGDIVTIDEKNVSETVMKSHDDGEVWGLTIDVKKGYVLTTGDDNKIMVFDPK